MNTPSELFSLSSTEILKVELFRVFVVVVVVDWLTKILKLPIRNTKELHSCFVSIDFLCGNLRAAIRPLQTPI
jgi:hypothetical protein